MTKVKILSLGLSALIALGATSALAESDIDKGKKAFDKKCKVCHAVEAGIPAKIGPNLFGVYNRTAGTEATYAAKGDNGYAAFDGAEFVWDDKNLREWLLNPKEWAKARGTKAKMKSKSKPKDVENIIAYLKTLK